MGRKAFRKNRYGIEKKTAYLRRTFLSQDTLFYTGSSPPFLDVSPGDDSRPLPLDESSSDEEGNFPEMDDSLVIDSGEQSFLGQSATSRNNLGINSHDNIWEFNSHDKAMVEVYKLCMAHGTSLQFVDDLFRLVKQKAKVGLDITKVKRRETFMKSLRKKMGPCATPMPESVVTATSEISVPKFSFLEQVKDLIASSDFQDLQNLVLNTDIETRFQRYAPEEDEMLLEIHSAKWYRETYDYLVTDAENDWLFPIVFYADKTGTDVMQRFPLEPLMFSTSVLKRNVRERSISWRHVGFVPPSDAGINNPEKNLQVYHDSLAVLLSELIHYQRSPPTITFTLGGQQVTKRFLFPVAFIIGDQQAQDKHCCRKAVNNGGAGRIHRRCMCSSMTGTDTSGRYCRVGCGTKIRQNIERLTEIVQHGRDLQPVVSEAIGDVPFTAQQRLRLEAYIKRRSRCARSILEKVYSTYAVNNAWSHVCFGRNPEGVYRATLDDPMHYCDSGSFMYLAKVAFLSMTETERVEMEGIIKSYFVSKRSGVREDLPKGKFSSGFTRTTLLTAGEKVGLIFALFVALGTMKAHSLFTKVIIRGQKKYETVSSSHPGEKRGDVYFFSDLKQPNRPPLSRTYEGVKRLVKELHRHNLDFVLDGNRFDELQTEYLLLSIHSTILGTSDGHGLLFPHTSIEEFYTAGNWEPTKNLITQLLQNVRGGGLTVSAETTSDNPGASKKIKTSEQRYPKKKITKHNIVRQKVQGNGSTSAILTDVEGFRMLLQTILSFQSFVHYFETIPSKDRQNNSLLQRKVRNLIRDFSACVYRGDDSVDCATPKLHSHLHLTIDIQDYGHPMNWEAGKGERGLKTWAKLASCTAQKHNVPMFTHQTALRVGDAMLLEKASQVITGSPALPQVQDTDGENPNLLPPTSIREYVVVRRWPHYIVDLSLNATVAVRIIDKTGKVIETMEDHQVIFPGMIRTAILAVEGSYGNFIKGIHVYKDATLRTNPQQEKKIRACAQYDKFGSFFDWVSVNYKWSGNVKKTLPAKLLLIYKDHQETLSAIIHACDWQGKDDHDSSNELIGRWQLEYSKLDGRTPVLRKVPISDIVDLLYVVEHSGNNQHPLIMGDGRPLHSVDVVEPRYMWATSFLS